jgi:hypothetical protein
VFGWQTFKRVGASRTINRIYKLVLTLSTVIQLSLFFVVTAVTIWLDQLINGAIGVMAKKSNLIHAMLTLVIIVGYHFSHRKLAHTNLCSCLFLGF